MLSNAAPRGRVALPVNLSLACRIVGRKLRIFDSFEGLPAGDDLDREAKLYKLGDYAGSLDEVRGNIQKYGAPECCEFVRGWFKDTLPKLRSPVVLAFLDVDLEASLDACVRYIYPNLTCQASSSLTKSPAPTTALYFILSAGGRELQPDAAGVDRSRSRAGFLGNFTSARGRRSAIIRCSIPMPGRTCTRTCRAIGPTIPRDGTTLYRIGPHTLCEALGSTAPSSARLRPRHGCTSGSRFGGARDHSAPGRPRKRSACRPE